MDMRNANSLPKHFRTDGKLHIAGGAQFSNLALKEILATLKTKTLTVIDLRQESHGFLDGNAVSWYANKNAANAGKTDAEIEANQAQLLDELSKQEIVTVAKIVTKSATGAIEKTQPKDYAVHQVATEQAVVAARNLNYKRFYVQDFHAPDAAQVDNFVKFVTPLPKNQWIYIHCRAGIGRTTTFMIMFDMLQNAKKDSFNEILKRQAQLGGKDLALLPHAKSYKYQWAVERFNFLKQFYLYARDNKDEFKTTWSQWNKS